MLTRSESYVIIIPQSILLYKARDEYLQKRRDIKVAPLIGEVYTMYFSGSGSEQSGWRPGIIFQNNTGNSNSPNIIALPLTTSIKKLSMPTHVLLKASDTGLRFDSMVLCENPEKMSKEKMGRYITTLSDEQMKEVTKASLLATGAMAFLDEETLISVWKESIQLNLCSA